jgi:valyl-tRNA synthetase
MQNELPKAYDPALIEQKWADFWVNEKIFSAPTPADPASINPFVQLLPPPNVTGRLHMGHMLNQTEMDILARWHRMSGDTSVWVPGTDHAGIATQMMVERQLKSEGKSRTDFTRDQFTELVWKWKQEYGGYITGQMKRLGASVDWSREYFTMDDRLSVAVKEAFVRLYEQGLIYRGAYIVNWDPVLGTAVSDLEVENEERLGSIYHVRYDLADGSGSITIATTRPETMLGDTAVAVNPTDERYTAFIGKELVLPLVGRNIPVVADDWANPEFGTGAVKVTPAHDPNDFALGQRHNLPQPSIMDTQARISLPGSPYDKLDRFEARKRIVADLEASGHLVAIKDHTLTLPISQRTSAVIEPRLSMQWFLAVNTEPKKPGAPSSPTASSTAKVGSQDAAAPNSIAAKAIAAVREGHIKFTPDMYSKTYFEWMNNLHDWCISRQLWWGHRIPAWHCDSCGCITVSRDVAKACSGCGITDIRQETDVLDTWFSSGLLPFTVFGWPGNEGSGLRAQGSDSSSPLGPRPSTLTPDLAAFYPTQLLVTGFDILFFWVARMIMLGTHFMLDVPMPDGSKRDLAHAVPFKDVYIHALVRDADRQKMSKTKGNVIDPIEIITKYGTDAARFTLASQASPGTDIAFNEARTEGYRAFCNKIWNAARFLQMNIERGKEAGFKITLTTPPIALKGTGFSPSVRDSANEGASAPEGTATLPDETPLETRWIYARLHAVAAEVQKSLAEYRFDEASQAVYQFFWGEFCDWYLELVKLRLNFDIPTEPLSSPTELLSSRSEAEGSALEPGESPTPAELRAATALTLGALVSVFESALRLLSPFMPFLTEELWHALYASVGQESPAKSIALTRYPQPADFYTNEKTLAAMETMQELITTIRALRKDIGVPEKEFTPIRLHGGARILALAQVHGEMLHRLARVSGVEISDAPLTGEGSRSTANFDLAIIYERQIDVPAERERLTKEIAKLTKGLEAANKQLGNEGFIARAPAHIVEGLKKQSTETQALYDKAVAALAALPAE